jgi:N-acetylglucosaminyldiphosphoundecaprenol N-acetyl-beta-D-mannosaminyltransferase
MRNSVVHHGFDLSVCPATPRESDFFGISIFNSSSEELVSRIEENLKSKTSTHIVALNPDGFLISQLDPDFRRILSIAEFVICDGVGILIASRLFSEQKIMHRLVGSGLMMRLCELSASKGHRVFLLGGTEGAAERCASSLQKRMPSLQIVGTYEPPLVTNELCFDNAEIVESINSQTPDILFVALGAPKQEKWIERHRRELAAPILMGVGASFDFIGGKVPRAPVWMQRVGIEWLFRLLVEPKRLAKRYLIGIPRFFLVTAQLYFRSQQRKGFQ